jgi:hypothetical protein
VKREASEDLKARTSFLDTIEKLIGDPVRWPVAIEVLRRYPHAAAYTFRAVEAMQPQSKVYLEMDERRAEYPEADRREKISCPKE